MNEWEIIRAAQIDPAAFAPLYDEYAVPVYRFCYRRVGSQDLANDLTTRVFIRVLERLDQYRPSPGATFRSWLFTIAHNLVADEFRRRRAIHVVGSDEDFGADSDPGPEDVAVHRDSMQRLRGALERLPAHQRNILELRLAGLTTPEIAVTLGVSAAAVKSAQSRAFAKLRIELVHLKGDIR